MLFRIQKKILGIKCVLDLLEYEEEILTVKGWIFSSRHLLSDFSVVIKSSDREYPVKIKYGMKRKDVYQALKEKNAKKSGFFGKILVENLCDFEVYFRFKISSKIYNMKIAEFHTEKRVENSAVPHVEKIETENYGIDIVSFLEQSKNKTKTASENLLEEKVDIIVPVYNGYQYLGRLLDTISHTNMKYRLILIDDKSPDERVLPFLRGYAESRPEVCLIKNEKNLGFVKSVNRALQMAEGHVALVNSDVELPDGWLERLMKPIFEDDRIASTTPYTNCGVITSFPNIGENNELFEGLPMEVIDKEFRSVTPKYTEMPTGVGFCMGMSRKAIQEIGYLDADNFGMGYGEENDWCQRAIKAGYKNVQVENLYVYHKHGGSFQSEDKKRFIEENSKILQEKHPTYEKQVAKFFSIDPNKELREFIVWNLIRKEKAPETILAFNHSLGGGASNYLIEKKNNEVKKGKAFCITFFDVEHKLYEFIYYYKKYRIRAYTKSQRELFSVLSKMDFTSIWINELVTYPHVYKMLGDISDFSKEKNVGIRMLMHDFFPVCPSINLIGQTGTYCELPEEDKCSGCFLNHISEDDAAEKVSIVKWRREWKKFLEQCREVIVFSNDSSNIVQKAFGPLGNIRVIPHKTNYVPELNKKYKTTNTLNIGLLGILTNHKGQEIVRELVQKIEKEKLNIRITLIGSSPQKINSPVFKETGRYTRGSIPKLVLENDIDAFLIPSVCPETFSYTTAEIMEMDMPVMCFNLGAPAERVARYEKGIVLPDMSIDTILATLKDEEIIQNAFSMKRRNKKVLFVVEEETFSSRYRVDHLREQLLCQGIASDSVRISAALKMDMQPYSSIVIYRSSLYRQTEEIVKRAHKYHKKVFYDIDDYIFNYTGIRNLGFLSGEDYVDFEAYTVGIRKSMDLCDAYIVSTENLRKAVEKDFPGKEVVVNRNVASLEMLTISKGIEKEYYGDEKIVLGYFSGSKTHDADFQRIKNVILDIMAQDARVHLLIGGQIELPSEFNKVYERIERFAFVDWRKLPALIAKADINLMPLEDTFFHACKSENKWMEAALVHVPTIASRNSELELAIEDGVNGYLCNNEEDWRKKMKLLINEEILRKQIATHAHEIVVQRYTSFWVEREVIEALVKANL